MAAIYAAFAEAGWDRPAMLLENYLEQQDRAERDVIVAWQGDRVAGYVTVQWQSDYHVFAEREIPEIADLVVLPHLHRQRVGSALLDEVERRIFQRSDTAGIGVGLYAGYGPAQTMYVRRGYVPDGCGVCYEEKEVRPYRQVRLDDDCVMHLVKRKDGGRQPLSALTGAQSKWFDALKNTLEAAYLEQSEPWKQSGLMIDDPGAWTACRRVIADCVERSGTFLDIGCANGYLLETLLGWTKERGIDVTPFGLDLSERLVDLAKERLPLYENNLFVGNGWNWKHPNPPRFDYVRTETVYVPESMQRTYVERLIDTYVRLDGRLLLTEYRSRKELPDKPWLDQTLAGWDMGVEKVVSGFYDGKEVTRVFIIPKPAFG